MFGWCAAGQHEAVFDESGKQVGGCKVKYKRFWLETKRKKSVVVYDNEYRFCDCPCHNAKVEPKKKPRARKRKT